MTACSYVDLGNIDQACGSNRKWNGGRICLPLLLTLFISFFGNRCVALTDEEAYRTLNFNIITPGARALGFGGAFIGLADDATAAEANPAGLTILVKPELFGEIRYSTFTEGALYNEGGLFNSTITNLTFQNGSDLTFFSLTYPTDYLTLAISRQLVMNIDSEVYSNFEFGSLLWELPPGLAYEETRGNLRLRLVNWNISVAKKLTETLSAGATIRICTLKGNSRVNNFAVIEGDTGRHFLTQIRHQADTAVGGNFGVLWRPKDLVSFGFVFRNEPRLQLDEVFIIPPYNAYEIEPTQYTFTNTINVPDSYGFGISFKPSSRFTVSGDIVRVIYSDLLENFRSEMNAISLYLSESGFELPFTASDANEYHLGAEYVMFLRNLPFAFRGGYYFNPPHRIHLDNDQFFQLNELDPEPFATVFADGEREHHYTVGLGISIHDNMQIDFAYDHAKTRSEAVASFIIRFK